MVFLSYPSYRVTKHAYKIIVNTTTKHLNLYKNNHFIKSYPVAIGKPSKPTPKGTYKIVNKAINPGGCFGVRWLGLNISGYGIHGTNNPDSIGKAVSNGCIRMYNKDILELANIVSIGTTVIII